MDKKEIKTAHNYFSKHCFNETWDYLDKNDLTDNEQIEVLSSAFASLYHWSNREDKTNQNMSVGYWQLSRVFAKLKDGPNALKFANLCLDVSQNEDVSEFYLGYAYEALARAEMINNNKMEMQKYLNEANNLCSKLIDKDEKDYLLADLNTIKL